MYTDGRIEEVREASSDLKAGTQSGPYQSLVSLVTIGLVIARAVNILQ